MNGQPQPQPRPSGQQNQQEPQNQQQQQTTTELAQRVDELAQLIKKHLDKKHLEEVNPHVPR